MAGRDDICEGSGQMSEWTHDPWHDKYFRPDPKYYYEPKTEKERLAYIRKWENHVPTTGDEWCLKNNYQVWKRNYDSKKELT